jgi:copper(I)-binding protein
MIDGSQQLTLTGLTRELRSGDVVQVTFLFDQAGPLTMSIPVATPNSPQPRQSVKPTAGLGENPTD